MIAQPVEERPPRSNICSLMAQGEVNPLRPLTTLIDPSSLATEKGQSSSPRKKSTYFGARALRDAHMVEFFFADFVTQVPNFQTCEANFSNTRINMDTILSLKNAQVPRLQFCQKILKNDFMVFCKEVLKNSVFDCFSTLIPFISELRLNTVSMVS